MTQDREPRDNGTPEGAENQHEASGTLRGTFPGHFRPTPEKFDRLWGEGMFVVDTNALLNLYRYSRTTRDEFLRVLRALQDRLYLPHQVGREFLERRLNTIRTQREGFSKLRQRVSDIRGEMEAELRKVLRLRPGEELPEGLRDALSEVPPKGYEALSEHLEELEKELPHASNDPDDDEAWVAVEQLVNGKLGRAFRDDELRRAEEEAARRRNAKIPPGFKDERPGDYVLWRQTIDEAKRSGKPVVLVTDDRKEDWWWIEQGETIGPRHELVAEMRSEAGVPFYMYTPDRLMSEARERLRVEVSDESISEAEGLGREPREDAAIDALSSWWNLDEMLDLHDLLTDDENSVLEAYIVLGADTDSVAEELGISRAEVSAVLERTRRKLRNRLVHSEPRSRGWSEPDWANAVTSVERLNRPLRRTETLVDTLFVRVKGDEDSIANFNRTILSRYPEVETIDREPTKRARAIGDVTLRLAFRPPVPAEHVSRAVEEVARETDLIPLMMTYSYFEP